MNEEAKKALLEKFHRHYESCWDYSMNVYDRGLTLEQFITEKRPDHTWMFSKPEPIHMSEVPEDIREEYIQYLRELLAEFWGTTVDELVYDDYEAACDMQNSIIEVEEIENGKV